MCGGYKDFFPPMLIDSHLMARDVTISFSILITNLNVAFNVENFMWVFTFRCRSVTSVINPFVLPECFTSIFDYLDTSSMVI